MKLNRSIRSAAWLALVTLGLALPVRAATRVWVCQSANNNWSTASNWAPAGTPQNGDDLVFAPGARFDSINNFASLRVRTITITASASITGNGLTVSNGITWSGAGGSEFNADVNLGQGQTWTSDGTSLTFGGNINLNGFNLLMNFEDYCHFTGSITGNGAVTKAGNGQLILGGGGSPNSFTGMFTHIGGELWAAKSPCFPGGFTSFGHTIVYNSGAFSPNHNLILNSGALLESSGDQSNTIASLVMTAARIEAFGMTLTVRSNIIINAANTNSAIILKTDLGNTGHLIQVANGSSAVDLSMIAGSFIGGPNGGFTKTGPGVMRLIQHGGAYGGTTIVSNGVVELADIGNSLGNNTGKTIVHSNATLRLLGPATSLSEPLELHGTGVGGTNGALHVVSGSSSLEGTITVPVGATIRCESTFHARSSLAGAGDIRFNGPGEFWNHGPANSLTGDLIVESGVFVMGKPSGASVNPNSTIHVGTNGIFGGGAIAVLRNWESNQVTGPVIIRSGSRWEIGSDTFEGAPDVTMLGNAEILANGGTFQLDGILTVQPQIGGSTARIHGGNVSFGSGAKRTISVQDIGGGGPDNIELIISPTPLSGSAPVVKTGSGDLRIVGLHSYNSPIFVDGGDLRVASFGSLGSGSGATIVTNNGRLVIEGGSFDQEPLVVSGGGGLETGNVFIDPSGSWRAPITLNAPLRAYPEAGETWTVNAPISGIGAFLVTGPGTVLFDWNTANTYTGGTWVRDGELRLGREAANVSVPGSLTIGDGTGAAGSARVVVSAATAQIADTADVYLFSDGRLVLTNQPAVEVIRTLSGPGEIVVSNSTLRLNDGGNDSNFGGIIRGNGDLIKAGAGTLTLTGFNGAPGLTLSLFGGVTVMDGNWSSAPGSLIDAFNGTSLEGRGIAQDVQIRGGATLAPGRNSPGILTVNRLTLLPSANLFLEISGGQPGVTHDQVVARDDVSLTNATLTLALNFVPTEGQVITLLDNRSVTPVYGTFSGRPQGSVFTQSGTTFILNYAGGDGNDITLTVTNTELVLASMTVAGGNGNGFIEANECNDLFLVLSNRSGSTLSGVIGTLDSLTPGIVVTRPQAGYPTIPPSARRTNTTAFRLTTTPEFECGTPVNLRLTVNAGTFGTFAMPLSLPGSAPGTPRAYSPVILGSVPIPDLGKATSFVAVANFPERIAKATVSLHLTHSYVGDLVLTLRSPAGKTVKLASRRGSSGDGYGTNCSPASARTTFDDASRNPIGSGAGAPFVGTFRPEEPLDELVGDDGGGTWALILEDAGNLDTGALLCWTLNLTPATCASGAGPCNTCTPLVTGNLAQAPVWTMPDRLQRDGKASLCGEPKLCPGDYGVNGSYRYRSHTFTNNGPATCITTLLRSQCNDGSLFLSAYLGTFNPVNLCANYLADSGWSYPLSQMAFPVPANGIFTIVVNEVTPGAGCANYSLELHGLPCPPPVLHIAPAAPGKVRLYWDAAAGEGYSLQSATSLLNGGATPFVTQPGTPALNGGAFNLTNDTAGGRQFYRLVKP